MAAFVQSNSNSNSGSGAVSVNITANPGVGNLLVACIGVVTGSITPTVTDTSGATNGATNTWTQFGSKYTQLGADFYVFYAFAAGSFAETVTVTWSGATGGSEVLYLEYSGMTNGAGTDGEVDNFSNTGTSVSSGNLATTNASDLLICYLSDSLTGTPTGISSGWTFRQVESAFGDCVLDKIVTSTGTYSLTCTVLGVGWATRVVAFKVSSSTTNVNATISLTPESVLTLTTQLSQPDVIAIAPDTVLAITTTLTQPDTVSVLSAATLTLNADVEEQAVMATTAATILGVTPDIANVDKQATVNPALATVASLVSDDKHSAIIFI